MYVGTLPVKVRAREKGVPKEEQEIIEKEHMNGNCNTILCAFIEMNLSGGLAQPSVKYLAGLIGGSVRSVIRCLDTLELSGLIIKQRRGCGWTNIYKIGLQLWKRVYVGVKKVVERVAEIFDPETWEPPAPTPIVWPDPPPRRTYKTKIDDKPILERIQMMEEDYEEATKPI